MRAAAGLKKTRSPVVAGRRRGGSSREKMVRRGGGDGTRGRSTALSPAGDRWTCLWRRDAARFAVLARLPGDAFTASSWTLALPDGRCTALAF